MGMFDWVKVKMPLPDSPGNDIDFQSKDTEDQFLTHYTITADGRLTKPKITRYEDRSDPKAEGFMSVLGMATPIIDGEVEIPFHGYIHFHHYNNKTREYWNYRAKFTDGKCVEITLLEHTICAID